MLRLLMTGLVALATTMGALQTAGAQEADAKWNQLIADAQKEGRVVLLAPPDASVREALPKAFEEKYGITVEYLGGRSSETAARIRSERQAGLYTVDVGLSGIQTVATIFYAEDMLDPIDTVLMDPEVTDGSKWRSGEPWFMDPEEKYVLRLFNTLTPFAYINTDHIDPDELKSGLQLLDPQYKGKIVTADPTVPGTGSNTAAHLYETFGEDYVKQLYIGQEPRIYRDRRQVTDAVLRGAFPIAIGAENEDMEGLREEGFPVQAVYGFDDLPGALSAGVGQVVMFNNAPNPNAAKLFVNWIASKEGMEVYARNRGGAPTRSDIDAESFLPVEMIPQDGVEYFDSYNWEFTLTTKEEIRRRMVELLGQ